MTGALPVGRELTVPDLMRCRFVGLATSHAIVLLNVPAALQQGERGHDEDSAGIPMVPAGVCLPQTGFCLATVTRMERIRNESRRNPYTASSA